MLKPLFLLALFAAVPLAFAEATIPEAPNGYVLDEANVLSEETEATLQTQLALLESENSSQMVVVTILTLNDYPKEMYALELGRSWGVGQEEFNNGLVFLVVVDDQETRIEVGYGLEGAITDAQSSSIINQVAIPYFKEGNYDQGVLESIQILDKLARGETFDFESVPAEDYSWFLDNFPFFIIGLWLLLSWLSSTKHWWAGGIFGAVLGLLIVGGLLGFLIGTLGGLLLDFILSTFLFGVIKPPRGGGFFGGGHGGSSGGGFGGFGGGSFGGGGASGRW